MATIPESLATALRHHQAGDLREAEALYRQVLQVDPHQVDALHLLGLLAHQVNNNALALDLIGQALRLRPSFAEAHNNLGNVLSAAQRMDDAVASYQEALRLNPDFAEAHNNLGNALARQGRMGEAAASYQRAVRLNPNLSHARSNLTLALDAVDVAMGSYEATSLLEPESAEQHIETGNALLAEQRPAEAEASYHDALRLRPDWALAYYNLGIAFRQQRKLQQAVASFEQALRLQPDYAEAHANLGGALMEQGKLDEAVASYHECLRLQPNLAEAYYNLGVALERQEKLDQAAANYQQAVRLRADFLEASYRLGLALMRQGKLDAAAISLRHAIRLNPNHAAAYSNLGAALVQQGRLDEAVACCQQALRLNPDYAEAHNALGYALSDQGKLDEAIASYRRALSLKPDFADAHHNLGIALREQGKLQQAVASTEHALRLQPDYPEARVSRALSWLLMGKFEQGWPEYESRWGLKGISLPPFPQPLWDGSPLAGRTILLHVEQGLGDMLQFIRYAPLVKQQGATVILQCPGRLARLFATCPGVDQIVSQDSAVPEFDVHAPLLSLPRMFGTSLATVPAEVPYLFAEPDRVEQWRIELSTVRAFKIGIAWQGSPRNQTRGYAYRPIPLIHFAPLAQVEGVQLFSLQKGAGTEQLREVANRFQVTDLAGRLDDDSGGFIDTAAVMKNLDLVISADTSVPHLAGALGVPVWVAIPFAPDWRWLLKGEDSAWYPTMRLFRQSEPDNWPQVFERMSDELNEMLAGNGVRNVFSDSAHRGSVDLPSTTAPPASPEVPRKVPDTFSELVHHAEARGRQSADVLGEFQRLPNEERPFYELSRDNFRRAAEAAPPGPALLLGIGAGNDTPLGIPIALGKFSEFHLADVDLPSAEAGLKHQQLWPPDAHRIHLDRADLSLVNPSFIERYRRELQAVPASADVVETVLQLLGETPFEEIFLDQLPFQSDHYSLVSSSLLVTQLVGFYIDVYFQGLLFERIGGLDAFGSLTRDQPNLLSRYPRALSRVTDQMIRRHISELERVTRPGGVIYFASDINVVNLPELQKFEVMDTAGNRLKLTPDHVLRRFAGQLSLSAESERALTKRTDLIMPALDFERYAAFILRAPNELLGSSTSLWREREASNSHIVRAVWVRKP